MNKNIVEIQLNKNYKFKRLSSEKILKFITIIKSKTEYNKNRFLLHFIKKICNRYYVLILPYTKVKKYVYLKDFIFIQNYLRVRLIIVNVYDSTDDYIDIKINDLYLIKFAIIKRTIFKKLNLIFR